jgi:hypothetical protein
MQQDLLCNPYVSATWVDAHGLIEVYRSFPTPRKGSEEAQLQPAHRQTWACVACTLVNAPERLVCALCHTQQDPQAAWGRHALSPQASVAAELKGDLVFHVWHHSNFRLSDTEIGFISVNSAFFPRPPQGSRRVVLTFAKKDIDFAARDARVDDSFCVTLELEELPLYEHPASLSQSPAEHMIYHSPSPNTPRELNTINSAPNNCSAALPAADPYWQWPRDFGFERALSARSGLLRRCQTSWAILFHDLFHWFLGSTPFT